MIEVPVPVTVETGNDAVDRVLDLVAGLDAVPLADHAAAFDQAHAELRRVLDAG